MNHDTGHAGGTGPSDEELGRLLNAAVDDELGARRAAPPFRPDRRPNTRTFRRSVRLGLPLLAAAAVIAVAATGVAVTQLNSAPRPTAPPANTTSPAPGSSTTAPPSTPPTTPSTPATTRSASSPPRTGTADRSTGSTPSTGFDPGPAGGGTTIDFHGYGAVSLGMTADQVAAAQPSLTRSSFGSPAQNCTQSYRPPSKGYFAIVLAPPTNRVIGITVPKDATNITDRGIAVGVAESRISTAYAGYHIERAHTAAGSTVLVQGPGSWLGFDIADGKVSEISVGSKEFVSHYEIWVGSQ